MIPERNGEGLRILRYKEGQKFMPHNDYFHDLNSSRAAFGGQRAATVLMYLATPEEGGETVFPQARVPPGLDSKGFSRCARGKLAVRPRKGDALLFFSLLPDGTWDPTSMHGSCPVLKGLKYSATRWMRAHPYEGGPRRKAPSKAPVVQSPAHEARLPSDGGDSCVDAHEDCAFWQENGQCEANPAYMARHCAGSCQTCAGGRGLRPAAGSQPRCAIWRDNACVRTCIHVHVHRTGSLPWRVGMRASMHASPEPPLQKLL